MAEIRTSSVNGVELLLPLDRDAGTPLHRQVEMAIRDAAKSLDGFARRDGRPPEPPPR